MSTNENKVLPVVPDEAIQAAVEAWSANFPVPMYGEIIEMLAAALPHLQTGFKVKQLEWFEVTRNAFRAETAFGVYEINSSEGGGFYWILPGVVRNHSQSAEEAKAEAQADFERRIRVSIGGGVDVAEVRRQALEEAANLCSEYAKSFQRGLCHYGDADKDSWRGRQEEHIDAGNELASAICALSAAPTEEEGE